MRKTLVVLLIVVGLKSQAQDSTKLLNVSFQARAIEYMASNLVNPDNSENFSTFLKWRALFQAAQPTSSTVLTIDTLPVNTAVYLYNWALSSQEGFGFSVLLKAVLTPYRQTNTNLNRQMTAIETAFINQVIALRATGRKWLLGK